MILETAVQTYLKFELRAVVGALPVAAVREVLPMARLTTPPHLAPSVAGLLNVAGVNLPVLRLDRLLGLADEPAGIDAHLILLRSDHLPCALLVDRVLGVDRIPPGDVKATPTYLTLGGAVTGEYTSGGRAVHVLALDQLLEAPRRALKVVA